MGGLRRALYLSTLLGSVVGGSTLAYLSYIPKEEDDIHPLPKFIGSLSLIANKKASELGLVSKNPSEYWTPPSRKSVLESLKKSNSKPGSDILDLIIIGGGATGAGVALDAVTRGLNVAVLDRSDFSSGTSSKSTKLVHGGVRYLEKAFWNLDLGQYNLVKEALHERGIFLRMCPYLTYQIPTLIPLYQYWKIPYYWAGCKAYDSLSFATGESLKSSYILRATDAMDAFPTLNPTGLKGALVYYDGAHNDSRMNISLLMTAVAYGALAINHIEVIDVIKSQQTWLSYFKKDDSSNKPICGVRIRDHLTGDEFDVMCKGVINATGPFIDGIRALDTGTKDTKPMVSPSSGIHVTLPGYYTPKNLGLIDPKTSDGRVLFFLPWQGSTILGTTDSPSSILQDPIPSKEDIVWLLKEAKKYFSPDVLVREEDVLSAWSGIRPLITDPTAHNTESLVRSHLITVSPSNLLTISGGKWTTFREMAKETVDTAVKLYHLNPSNECITDKLRLIGSHSWSRTFAIKLIQNFGVHPEIADHLSHSYGDRAWKVLSYGNNKQLHSNYPYLESEVTYAVQDEYACTAIDVLARRTRLTFLNTKVSEEVLPRVVQIMGDILDWSPERRIEEVESGEKFLISMGSEVLKQLG